ncbi:MAG: type II secretion system protein [Candidatus Saccharimonadaceae bacterium]
MKTSKGFTVIELLVVLVFAGTAAIIFLNGRTSYDAMQRDNQRKIAINAMYYSLEEVFYEKNKYYPESLDSKTLRSVDPELFTDPSGIKLGEGNSTYRYEPAACTDGKCKSYSLIAVMEREDDYRRDSRNR